jgi:hypothetical protein
VWNALVVTNVLREQSLQMAFIYRDNVVKQVSSAAFDPTLRYTVLPGLSKEVRTGPFPQKKGRKRNFLPYPKGWVMS